MDSCKPSHVWSKALGRVLGPVSFIETWMKDQSLGLSAWNKSLGDPKVFPGRRVAKRKLPGEETSWGRVRGTQSYLLR